MAAVLDGLEEQRVKDDLLVDGAFKTASWSGESDLVARRGVMLVTEDEQLPLLSEELK